jgi:hypothetical protein
MPQMQNRVQETTTTGGTGTLTLSGAVTGYITFASGFSTGASLFYTVDNGVGEWEIGIGTLVTTGTLSRVTVIASSNGGALVNFGSGTKRVFCSAPTRSLVPDQDSNSGKVLTTDGTNPAWTTTLNGITIGNLTAAAGAFTTLSASSTVSGTGFSTYLASPPAIGGTAAAAGAFTTLSSSSTTTVGTNLVFSGTGNRITGDFSNATVANRVAFQTSVSNSQTNISILPSGSAASSTFTLEGDSATSSGATVGLLNNAGSNGEARLFSDRRGSSATYLPLTIYTGGSERVRISTAGVVTVGSNPASPAISLDPTTANALVVNSSGNVGIGTASPSGDMKLTIGGNDTIAPALNLINGSVNGGVYLYSEGLYVNARSNHPLYFRTNNTERARITSAGDVLVTGGGGLGYGTGSGGAVTQATNKSTAVTLNKPTGQITMNNASLAAGASVVFTLSNTFVNSTTIPVVTTDGYTNYRVECAAVNGSGQAFIRVTNVSGSNLGDAVVINFAIIKGATS